MIWFVQISSQRPSLHAKLQSKTIQAALPSLYLWTELYLAAVLCQRYKDLMHSLFLPSQTTCPPANSALTIRQARFLAEPRSQSLSTTRSENQATLRSYFNFTKRVYLRDMRTAFSNDISRSEVSYLNESRMNSSNRYAQAVLEGTPYEVIYPTSGMVRELKLGAEHLLGDFLYRNSPLVDEKAVENALLPCRMRVAICMVAYHPHTKRPLIVCHHSSHMS